MSTPAIQSVLQDMQALSGQAANLDGPRGNNIVTAVGQGGFAEELHGSIERINQLQQTSKEQVQAFQRGDAGVELNDVMVDVQKASVAFEMGVQVRNRLVTAYKDIMNMRI